LELQREAHVDLSVSQEEGPLVQALSPQPPVTSSLHLLVSLRGRPRPSTLDPFSSELDMKPATRTAIHGREHSSTLPPVKRNRRSEVSQ